MSGQTSRAITSHQNNKRGHVTYVQKLVVFEFD
jgi:hypothetical protein